MSQSLEINGPLLTFERWAGATSDLTDQRRSDLFDYVSAEESADCWQRLRERLEGDRIADGVLDLRRRHRPQLNTGARRIEHTIHSGGAADREDVLEAIAPPEYVEALIGEAVPPHGMICCPCPDHEDRTPSCHVYAQPGRGWYCHGCHRGGGAIDLAAFITGIEPRGSGYIELRKMVAEKLLGALR